MKKYNVICELEFEYLASDPEHAIDILTRKVHIMLDRGEVLDDIGNVYVKTTKKK
jgi:hypothetical protein